jgi:hypothetical protein
MRMHFSEEKLDILVTIDKAFDVGTRENYILNNILLTINLLLVGVFALDIAQGVGFLPTSETFSGWIHNLEIVFGMLFLVEFTLRAVFVYIPDRKFFSAYSIINAMVIISLLAPHFIGNLVLLRFLQIFKVYKVFKLNQDKRSYHVDEDSVEESTTKSEG